MKKFKLLIALILAAMLLPSCMKTQTYVGDYQKLTYNGSDNHYEYFKAKRVYLFGGLIPLGKCEPDIPPTVPCEILTKQTFVDGLLSGLTQQIVTFQTVQINAVKDENPKK